MPAITCAPGERVQSRAAVDAANKGAASWVQQTPGGLVGNVEITMGEVAASSAQFF